MNLFQGIPHHVLLENPIFVPVSMAFEPSFIVRRLGKLLMKEIYNSMHKMSLSPGKRWGKANKRTLKKESHAPRSFREYTLKVIRWKTESIQGALLVSHWDDGEQDIPFLQKCGRSCRGHRCLQRAVRDRLTSSL